MVPAATEKQATTGDGRLTEGAQLQPRLHPHTGDDRRMLPETFWTRVGVEYQVAHTKDSCKNALIASRLSAPLV